MGIKWLPLRPKKLVASATEKIKTATSEKNKALDEIYEMQYGKKAPKKK